MLGIKTFFETKLKGQFSEYDFAYDNVLFNPNNKKFIRISFLPISTNCLTIDRVGLEKDFLIQVGFFMPLNIGVKTLFNDLEKLQNIFYMGYKFKGGFIFKPLEITNNDIDNGFYSYNATIYVRSN